MPLVDPQKPCIALFFFVMPLPDTENASIKTMKLNPKLRSIYAPSRFLKDNTGIAAYIVQLRLRFINSTAYILFYFLFLVMKIYIILFFVFQYLYRRQ